MRGYLADTLDGKDSLLIVGSNDDAAQLSREIRDAAHRLRPGRQPSRSTELGRRAGGVEVSVGDRVQARQVDRTIRVDGGQHRGEPGHLHGAGARRGRGAAGARRRRRDRAPAAPLRRRAPDLGLRVHGARGAGPHRGHLPRAARRGRRAGGRLRGAVARAGGELPPTWSPSATRTPTSPQRLDGTAAGPAGRGAGQRRGPPRRARSSGGSATGTGRRWRGSAPSGTRCPRTAARARYTDQLAAVLEPDAVAARDRARRAGRGWSARCGRPSWPGTTPRPCWPARWSGRPLDDAQQVSDVLRWRVRVLAARPHPRAAGAGRATGPRWRRRSTARSGSSPTSSPCSPRTASTSWARPRSTTRPRGRSPSWARPRPTTTSPPRSRPGRR